MIASFSYYMLNIFFTIGPLNMLFRVFPSEKRTLRSVHITSVLYLFIFSWMIFVPPSVASKYSMLLIYPFTAFSFFFFLGGTKSFKFILICLLLSKAKVFTILIKGPFGLFFKIRHLNFTTNGCSFFIRLIGEKQYSVKI